MTSRRLESLYDAHAQSVFAFLLHLTRCEETTRDLLQEVFLRLARRRIPLIRKPRPYLLRLAHNAWIDHVRAAAARARTLERSLADSGCFPPPSHDAEHAELSALLIAGMADLPADQRAVVHLKIWDNLTFREISSALGIPTHTAASRYRYALDKLRAAMRPSIENERA
ncbi:MAG: sigma-70 family RNA polymerase sigma factor [Terrimicrobiaceae bacterium]|nr:sigma-70 family RNA polymerase sigma factor [Terrimicrobiaceae bacterium]